MRWLLLLLLIGCGDNGAAGSDAAIDARVDAPRDALPSGCDYVEQEDGTNDTSEAGTAEVTDLRIDPPVTLCGVFDSTHFDQDITVDADAFHVTVPNGGPLLVRLESDASSIELAGVDVYSGATFSTLVATATWYGDHAVTAFELVPGTYEILVYALNSSAIASDIDYRVKFFQDDPNRCASLTSGGIAEANDGANNTGNDVYSVPSGSPIALTPSNADAPEPAGTVAPGAHVRLFGTLADVAVADQYEDRDTFSFEVPNGANELSVELEWQGAGDLDFLLFEGTKLQPETRALRATTSPEKLLYSVKAGVTYSIMFAAKPGAAFPVAYSATMCSESYVP